MKALHNLFVVRSFSYLYPEKKTLFGVFILIGRGYRIIYGLLSYKNHCHFMKAQHNIC